MKRIFFLILIFIITMMMFLGPVFAAPTYYIQTSQSDFEENTLTDIDTFSSPGNVQMSVASNAFSPLWDAGGLAVTDHHAQAAKVIADGSGNSIIAYYDNDMGGIYAQKINSGGTVEWTSSGLDLFTTDSNPEIISDGHGGAIISWGDYGSDYDIYAQRINSSGTPLWNSGSPVAISVASGDQYNIKMVADGSDGAILTWLSNLDPYLKIYAQRINSSGAVQWTTNGVEITDNVTYNTQPEIVSDNSGGAIITWSYNQDVVYAQKIDSGAVQWTANGVVIKTPNPAYDQEGLYPKISADGSGGAIITWQETGASWNNNIYAQKINTDGDLLWDSDGIVINSNLNYGQISPAITTDGSGGALIVWLDNRSYSYQEIYCQKVNSDGSLWWNGYYANEPITTETHSLGDLSIVSDSSSGAIISWLDTNYPEKYIYVQKIGAVCNSLWTTNGEVISSDLNANGTEAGAEITVDTAYDGSGGAYITWNTQSTLVSLEPFLFAQDVRNVPTYVQTGTMTSKVFDAGENVSFSTISWTENLPTNTAIRFQTRTAPNNALDNWRDDFNDGNVANVSVGAYTWPDFNTGNFAWPPTEPGGVLTFVNPEVIHVSEGPPVIYDDYFITINTGQAAEYYPEGSVVTARVKIVAESPSSAPELSMFVDNWDVSQGYTTTANDWTEISYTTGAGESFNTIGFDLYGLAHEEGYDDQLLIDWITIEPPAGEIVYSDWSTEVTNPAGSTITSPPGRYIQYKANFLSTLEAPHETPALRDVMITANESSDGITNNVNITADVQATLSLALSATNCNLELLDAFNLKTCNYTTTASTNGSNGYVISLQADGNFRNASHEIGNVGDGSITAGSEEYGFSHTLTAIQCNALNGHHDNEMTALALTTSSQSIDTASGPVFDQQTTLCHGVAISGTTPAGSYGQKTMLTIVSNY